LAIVATGIDIVEVPRVAQMIEKHGSRFVNRVFTPDEIRYCRSRGVPEQHFAGRFAAKEAVFKVLGTGWGEGVQWGSVEVTHNPQGAPQIILTGRAEEIATEMGIGIIHISISHTAEHAVAHAIAEADRP
jgi:holo-[acyl-carrier protein] synthase